MLLGLAGLTALATACGPGTASRGSRSGNSSQPTVSTPLDTGGAGSTTAPTPSTTPPGTTARASSTFREALDEAYETETATLATYKNVITALGPVGPFPMILEAEKAHVLAIRTLFSHYGLNEPVAETGEASPATRTAACGLGVTMEKKVISTYDELFSKVGTYPDVTLVFKNLQSASRDNHLPAFERCA